MFFGLVKDRYRTNCGHPSKNMTFVLMILLHITLIINNRKVVEQDLRYNDCEQTCIMDAAINGLRLYHKTLDPNLPQVIPALQRSVTPRVWPMSLYQSKTPSHIFISNTTVLTTLGLSSP